MSIRNIFENYFLSWFKKPEFDYDRLLVEQDKIAPLPLTGKFDWGVALDYYKEENSNTHTLLSEYLYRFKYNQDEKCGQILSTVLKIFLDNNPMEYNIDLTTFVPVTVTGRIFRIMEYILTRPDIRLPGSFIPRLLMRRKVVGQAKDIQGAWRKREVIRDIYKINENFEFRDKNILIFDDIYDSGATLDECTRILKNAGANNILAITLVLTRRGQD